MRRLSGAGLRALALLASLAGAAAWLAPSGARAQLGDRLDELELADTLEVIVLEREVLAVDAKSGGQLSEALELGESVISSGARGRVGVVVTDRRLLAVGTGSAAWQETRWRRTEAPATDVRLGARVAIATTNARALGFDGRTGNLVERTLGPRERVLDGAAGGNVAVVLTDRRALGVSAYAGGFFETRLRLGESIEELSALASLATLRTSQRLLVFRAQGGSWEERTLDLR